MHRLNDPDDEMFVLGDGEDLQEVRERCVGLSLDANGWTTETYGRMRRRAVETDEDFEGLPVEEPPGYARP